LIVFLQYNLPPVKSSGIGKCTEICYKDPVLEDHQWSAYIDRSPGQDSYSLVSNSFYRLADFIYLFYHYVLSFYTVGSLSLLHGYDKNMTFYSAKITFI
jgi:hypothetical protein